MILLHSITIPDYPMYVKLSEKQRAVYYKCKHKDLEKFIEKLPKKYNTRYYGMKTSDKINYLKPEENEYFLFNITTGEKVIKNEKKVGTPRMYPIRGNDLFTPQSNPVTNTKILDCIKEWFLQYWTKEEKAVLYGNMTRIGEGNLFKPPYPLAFRFIYRCPRSQVQDIGNLRLYYEKAIPDVLQDTILTRKSIKDKYIKVYNPVGIMPDDNVDYNNQITSRWEESEIRELELKIYEA